MSATGTDPAVTAAATAPAKNAPDSSAGGTGRQAASMPWSVVGAAVPFLVGAVRLAMTVRRPYDHAGDHAIFEAAIRRVASGAQTLGPYSRFDFHQPGPAYFEAQAPFYWLSGANGRALFLGALCMNLGAALACVLVVRRYLGERTARWTALVVGAYVIAMTPALVADPWPVYVLALPFLLLLVLAAATATGSIVAAAGMVICGSYLVQTHVATGAAVIVVMVVGIALATTGAIRRNRRSEPLAPPRSSPSRRIRTGAVLLLSTVILSAMWVPPFLEEVSETPGNLTTLARFFNQAHPEYDEGYDHGLRFSAGQVVRQLTLLPLGRRADRGPAGPLDVAIAASGLLAAGAVVAAGRRRTDRFLLALGVTSLLGTAVAVWSATRIVGAVLPYLLLWTSGLLIPAWIGLGAVVATRRRVPRLDRIGSALLAAGVVSVALTSGWSMLRAPLPPLRSAGDVTAATALARDWLTGHGLHRVRVQLGDHSRWPLAAGMILRLEKDGVAVSVDGHYTNLFGDQFAPNDREDATVLLTPPGLTPPPGEGLERLGEANGSVVWAGLRPPR